MCLRFNVQDVLRRYSTLSLVFLQLFAISKHKFSFIVKVWAHLKQLTDNYIETNQGSFDRRPITVSSAIAFLSTNSAYSEHFYSNWNPNINHLDYQKFLVLWSIEIISLPRLIAEQKFHCNETQIIVKFGILRRGDLTMKRTWLCNWVWFWG